MRKNLNFHFINVPRIGVVSKLDLHGPYSTEGATKVLLGGECVCVHVFFFFFFLLLWLGWGVGGLGKELLPSKRPTIFLNSNVRTQWWHPPAQRLH